MTRRFHCTGIFCILAALMTLPSGCADMPSDYQLWPREDGDEELVDENAEDQEDTNEGVVPDGDIEFIDKDSIDVPQTGTAFVCVTAFDGQYDTDAQQADFGMVRVDSRPGSVHLAIWNCGDAEGTKNLLIRSFNVQDSTAAFSVDAPDASREAPVVLPPRGSAYPREDFIEIWLSYEPREPTPPDRYDRATLEIRTNSDLEAQRRFVITMQGQAEVFGLEFSAEALDFGAVPYGNSASRTIDISNATSNDIVIAGFTVTGDNGDGDVATSFVVAQLGGSGDLLLEPAEEALSVQIKYSPKPLLEDGQPVNRNDAATFHIRWCFTFQENCALCEDPSDTECRDALNRISTSTGVPMTGMGLSAPDAVQ